MLRLILLSFSFPLFSLPYLYHHQSFSQKEHDLICYVREAIEKGHEQQSKLPKAAEDLPGMSSAKMRHFMNHLLRIPKTVYFEVGLWKGSTFISALYGNKETVIDAKGCDNFSYEDSDEVTRDLFANLESFSLVKPQYKFYDCDSFAMDLGEFHKPVTVYFYDGSIHLQSSCQFQRRFECHDFRRAPQ